MSDFIVQCSRRRTETAGALFSRHISLWFFVGIWATSDMGTRKRKPRYRSGERTLPSFEALIVRGVSQPAPLVI